MYNNQINTLINDLVEPSKGSNFEGFMTTMQTILTSIDKNILSNLISKYSNGNTGYYKSSVAKIRDTFYLDTTVLPQEIKAQLQIDTDQIVMGINKFADLSIIYKVNKNNEVEQIKFVIETDQHNNSISDIYEANIDYSSDKGAIHFAFKHALKDKKSFKTVDLAVLTGKTDQHNHLYTFHNSVCNTGKHHGFQFEDQPINQEVFED